MLSGLLVLLQILLLLAIANGAPVLARKLFGDRFGVPLDAGLMLPDGRPLFGASKTIRGILVSLGATAAGAALLGFPWLLGLEAAAAAMAGDLLSSFLKRRLGLPPHAQAFGLDQVPEALLPLLLLRQPLGLSAGDIMIVLAAFVVLELVLSRLLFRVGLREQPY